MSWIIEQIGEWETNWRVKLLEEDTGGISEVANGCYLNLASSNHYKCCCNRVYNHRVAIILLLCTLTLSSSSRYSI